MIVFALFAQSNKNTTKENYVTNYKVLVGWNPTTATRTQCWYETTTICAWLKDKWAQSPTPWNTCKKKNEQIPYSFNQQATISNTTYLILHNVQGIEKSEKPKLWVMFFAINPKSESSHSKKRNISLPEQTYARQNKSAGKWDSGCFCHTLPSLSMLRKSSRPQTSRIWSLKEKANHAHLHTSYLQNVRWILELLNDSQLTINPLIIHRIFWLMFDTLKHLELLKALRIAVHIIAQRLPFHNIQASAREKQSSRNG